MSVDRHVTSADMEIFYLNFLDTISWVVGDLKVATLKPLSVTNKSVDSRTATERHNSSAQVARSGRSRTDAVICNIKGLISLRKHMCHECLLQ